MSVSSLPFAHRLWLWLTCWVRVLIDGAFAARVWQVRHGAAPRLPASGADGDGGPSSAGERAEPVAGDGHAGAGATAASGTDSALLLLGLLQREGRLVDFLEQDISAFADAEVGAAARVVHEGCRKALRGHAEVVSVRDEEEDSRVEVAEGVESGVIKLTGNVTGKPPYRGVLRHRGWRVLRLELPAALAGHDPSVVAPAEVEL